MLLAPLICLALCRLLELCSLRRRSPESKELEIGVLRVGCVNPIGWAVVRRRDLASVLRRELTGRPTNRDDYVYAPHRPGQRRRRGTSCSRCPSATGSRSSWSATTTASSRASSTR